MIPKIIHYCWFGRGKKSRLMKRCIKSWRKRCPGYKIIEWNEDNFEINKNRFAKEAYECKKWAFVSDYVRMCVLYEYGGIYFDTDIELKKSMDDFLENKAFTGFETDKLIQTGVFGAEPKQEIIKEFRDYYNDKTFLKDGKHHTEPNVKYITDILLDYGLKLDDSKQLVNGIMVYPQTYFCPLCITSNAKKFSKNTHAIHHFTSSWRKKSELKTFKRVRRHQTGWYRTYEKAIILPQKTMRRVFGNDRVDRIKDRVKWRR